MVMDERRSARGSLPYMLVRPYIGMLKNLFSKLKRKQEVISVDTNAPKESEENLEKKEK
jgi:hypothetical protein